VGLPCGTGCTGGCCMAGALGWGDARDEGAGAGVGVGAGAGAGVLALVLVPVGAVVGSTSACACGSGGGCAAAVGSICMLLDLRSLWARGRLTSCESAIVTSGVALAAGASVARPFMIGCASAEGVCGAGSAMAGVFWLEGAWRVWAVRCVCSCVRVKIVVW
jgi:hypothetical protein